MNERDQFEADYVRDFHEYSTAFGHQFPRLEDWMTVRATTHACMVLHAVACGMPLLIPRSNAIHECRLVNRPKFRRGNGHDIVVPRFLCEEIFSFVVLRDWLHELAEDRVGYRAGWRELGLDGVSYRCYVCVQ